MCDNNKLKPCPFCGGEAYEDIGSVEYIQKRLEKLEELERLIEIGQLRRSCFVYTSHGA